jgi:hypothetical protein
MASHPWGFLFEGFSPAKSEVNGTKTLVGTPAIFLRRHSLKLPVAVFTSGATMSHCGWDIAVESTKAQRRSLHKAFAFLVANPEAVRNFSRDQADSVLDVFKEICELCKTEEGVEPQPTK